MELLQENSIKIISDSIRGNRETLDKRLYLYPIPKNSRSRKGYR